MHEQHVPVGNFEQTHDVLLVDYTINSIPRREQTATCACSCFLSVNSRVLSKICEHRALRDGRCNLVQLGSKISTIPKTDWEGKLVPVDSDLPDESWETRAIREAQVRYHGGPQKN